MNSRKPVAKPEDPAKASPTLAKKISGTSAKWSVHFRIRRLSRDATAQKQELCTHKVLVGIDWIALRSSWLGQWKYLAFFYGVQIPRKRQATDGPMHAVSHRTRLEQYKPLKHKYNEQYLALLSSAYHCQNGFGNFFRSQA